MKKKSILFLAFLFILSCKKDAAKEVLALNLEKGYTQTLIYSTSTDNNSNGSMNDATEVKYRVDSIDGSGNYYLTGEIIRMTYNQKMFDETLHFDSRETTNNDPMMTTELMPLINNPFTFKIDKHGEVMEKQKFTKEIVSDLDASTYNIIPLNFPREAISVGHIWTQNKANPAIKSMSMTDEYFYSEPKEKELEILISSKISGMGIMKDTDIKGKYIFDRKTKALISATREMPVQIGGGSATFTILTVE